jgi:beta-glucosidase
MTMNEPVVVGWCGYTEGSHAPGVHDVQTARQVVHHILLAHARAVKICRATLPNAKIGLVPAISMEYGATDDPRDIQAAEDQWLAASAWQLHPMLKGGYPERAWEQALRNKTAPYIQPNDFDEMREPGDFIGVNLYFSFFHGHDKDGKPTREVGPVKEFTGHNWPIYPDGLRDALVKITQQYGPIPLYVSENGAAWYDEQVTPDGAVHDEGRVKYLQRHLNAIHEAIERGVDLRGYFVWSLMDNFEWGEGYRPRFGITHVDYKTLKRTIKDSGKYYAEVARLNAL